MQGRSAAQIIAKIGCPRLNLYKGDGYWYFVYDDPVRNIYETTSVFCKYLNGMALDLWVGDGKAFVAAVEKDL